MNKPNLVILYLVIIIFEKIIDKEISQKYNNNNKSPKKADQYFLTDHVYSLLVDESVIHDSFFDKNYMNSLAFPTKRNGTCFVGSASNFEKCMSHSIEQLNKFVCPLKCRCR